MKRRWLEVVAALHLLCGALTFALPILAAEAPQPSRPKDAAEAVQEGNVDNWLKYYQREREQSSAPQPAQAPRPSEPSSEPRR